MFDFPKVNEKYIKIGNYSERLCLAVLTNGHFA